MGIESLLEKLESVGTPVVNNDDIVKSMCEGVVQTATVKTDGGQAPAANSVCQKLIETIAPDANANINYEQASEQPSQMANFDLTFNNAPGNG